MGIKRVQSHSDDKFAFEIMTADRRNSNEIDGVRDSRGKLSFRKTSLHLIDLIGKHGGAINVPQLAQIDDAASHSNASLTSKRKPLFGSSRYGQSQPKLKKVVEPTYKLGPDKGPEKQKVKNLLNECIKAKCGERKFQAFMRDRSLIYLNKDLHKKLKNLVPERHRFILQLSCFENGEQGIASSSNFLWNPSHDDFICVQFSNKSFTLLVVCFLIYLE